MSWNAAFCERLGRDTDVLYKTQRIIKLKSHAYKRLSMKTVCEGKSFKLPKSLESSVWEKIHRMTMSPPLVEVVHVEIVFFQRKFRMNYERQGYTLHFPGQESHIGIG